MWFSPVLIYLSYILYRDLLGSAKRLNSKIGDYVSYVSIIGFVLTLFLSFYVNEHIFIINSKLSPQEVVLILT
ncbi:DUF1240 domain-containing protein [Xenorhabdus sp. 12]|uniref:DUF1240 domain-containing protein n=1 Tax=Xenorhabdus santafensis TaxID=2582833 RepID=A0ABU4SCF4_9GAMM|nr:DUF1240 domain-containing protein [Xenorhabdus sp. 12]